MEEILIKYCKLVLAVYIIRFLTTRLLLAFYVIKKILYMREMLPGVKNWNSRIKKAYYSEIFSFIQSLILALYFMLFCYFIPLSLNQKVVISFLLYFTFITIEKFRFSIIWTNFPNSLLLMDTFIYLFVSLLQFMAMGFLYN